MLQDVNNTLEVKFNSKNKILTFFANKSGEQFLNVSFSCGCFCNSSYYKQNTINKHR